MSSKIERNVGLIKDSALASLKLLLPLRYASSNLHKIINMRVMMFGFGLVTVVHNLHHHFQLIQLFHVVFILNDDYCAHDLGEDGT